MIAHTVSASFKTASRRYVNIVSACLVATSLLLAGCGGGGGGSSVAGVTPSDSGAAFTDTRMTLPDAASNSFAPNYAPAVVSYGTWQGRTLRVFFAPESEAVVFAALRRWEDSTGGYFHWERVGSEGEAQVVFMRTPASDFDTGTVGRTRYSYNTKTNELLSAEVKYAATGVDADQTRVVVHELGHVLGIHGHSDSEPDVMYPTLTARNVITQRDLNTLFFLYRNATEGYTSASRSVGDEASATIACGTTHNDSN